MLPLSNPDHTRQFGHVRPTTSQRLQQEVLNLQLQFLHLINNQHRRRLIAFNGFLGISERLKKLASFKEIFRPHKCSRRLRIGARVDELLDALLLSSESPAPKHLASSQAFDSGNVKESQIAALG